MEEFREDYGEEPQDREGPDLVEWKFLPVEAEEEEIYISRFEESAGQEEADTDPETMPRHFATVRIRSGRWEVEDTSTKFGVLLNGERISQAEKLKPGDELCIGGTRFALTDKGLKYSHREYTQNSLEIHIEKRTVWQLFKKKTLLKDIDLTIYPGEMVLLLGGSGAGKTTFVNAVTGYEKADAKILQGGQDVYREYSRLKYQIGFVPQQDLLRLEDTVAMTMENAAELRMPVDTDAEARKSRVDEVLEMFGLEQERNNLVGKLSGGQRKRLSIGVEFVADPELFILDEPDSGLDGVMARELMEYLRAIADQKKIVIVITHTPDRVIDLFDKVIVLAKGGEDPAGQLAYYGRIDEARTFFGKETMEEILRLIDHPDEGGEGQADTFIQKFDELEGEESDPQS